jgi:hypothetical protein
VTQGQPNGDREATRKVNGSHKPETRHEPELNPGTEDALESSSKPAPALTPAPSEPTELVAQPSTPKRIVLTQFPPQERRG